MSLVCMSKTCNPILDFPNIKRNLDTQYIYDFHESMIIIKNMVKMKISNLVLFLTCPQNSKVKHVTCDTCSHCNYSIKQGRLDLGK